MATSVMTSPLLPCVIGFISVIVLLNFDVTQASCGMPGGICGKDLTDTNGEDYKEAYNKARIAFDIFKTSEDAKHLAVANLRDETITPVEYGTQVKDPFH